MDETKTANVIPNVVPIDISTNGTLTTSTYTDTNGTIIPGPYTTTAITTGPYDYNSWALANNNLESDSLLNKLKDRNIFELCCENETCEFKLESIKNKSNRMNEACHFCKFFKRVDIPEEIKRQNKIESMKKITV